MKKSIIIFFILLQICLNSKEINWISKMTESEKGTCGYYVETAFSRDFYEMDCGSFRHLAGNYYRDKKNVYLYLEDNRHIGYVILENLNPDAFVMINDMYVRDDKNIYMYDLYLEGADVKTFSILNGLVSKDKNAVYYYGKKIENADPATFEIIDSSYFKDKKNIYYEGKVIKGA